MFRHDSLPVAKRLVIAGLVGSTCGAAAGLWSIGRGSKVPSSTGAVIGSPPSSPVGPNSASGRSGRHDATVGAAPVRSVQGAPTAHAGTAPAATAPASASSPASTAANGQDLLRARALAQRADVRALVALRDTIVRRAEAGSPASKQQLDMLDRYLDEARLLRLKLDAEEFKHAEAVGSRPR